MISGEVLKEIRIPERFIKDFIENNKTREKYYTDTGYTYLIEKPFNIKSINITLSTS